MSNENIDISWCGSGDGPGVAGSCRHLTGVGTELVLNATGYKCVLARLSDQEPVLDAMARLRRVWPNLMHVERQRLEASGQTETRRRRRELDPETLFRAFWTEVTGEEELPEGGDSELKEAVETVRAEDREEDAA